MKSNFKISVTELFVAIFISVLAFGPVVIYAASSANVTATVTIQNVSVSVSDGAVAYGTVSSSGTEDTTSAGINDSQTATNDGNINEDLNIRGTNSTNWTLAGTAGVDTYVHSFCTTTCDSSPVWTALTTSNQTLSATVASSGNQVFDLEFGAPTSSTTFTQESLTVTVQASAS